MRVISASNSGGIGARGIRSVVESGNVEGGVKYLSNSAWAVSAGADAVECFFCDNVAGWKCSLLSLSLGQTGLDRVAVL
jgi:hypothetical protein